MSQNSQTHFKNLAANPAKFSSVSDHFGTLCIKGLRQLFYAMKIELWNFAVKFLSISPALEAILKKSSWKNNKDERRERIITLKIYFKVHFKSVKGLF